jgi:hypothetical protein
MQYTQLQPLHWMCLLRVLLLKGRFLWQGSPHPNSHEDGSWASMVVHNHPPAILLLKYIGGHSPAHVTHASGLSACQGFCKVSAACYVRSLEAHHPPLHAALQGAGWLTQRTEPPVYMSCSLKAGHTFPCCLLLPLLQCRSQRLHYPAHRPLHLPE